MTNDERRRDDGSEQESPDTSRKNPEAADTHDPTDEIDIHTANTLPPGQVDRDDLIAESMRHATAARTVTAGGSGAADLRSGRLPDQIGGYKILGLLGRGGSLGPPPAVELQLETVIALRACRLQRG